MNEIEKVLSQDAPLPAVTEAAAIANAANEDAGFEKLLKFKKGVYTSDANVVEWGTEFVAHCVGWTKCWIKFVDQQVADRKMFRVAEGKRPPEREELDDLQLIGVKDPKTGMSVDPWVYQYLLPMEDKAGELVVFVTSSTGGKRAVADLCKSYSRRAQRSGKSEQPVIKLSGTVMPTRNFGDIPRPLFEIVGWDSNREGIREVKAPDTLRQEMDDEIPF
jgi:hypothetical protein